MSQLQRRPRPAGTGRGFEDFSEQLRVAAQLYGNVPAAPSDAAAAARVRRLGAAIDTLHQVAADIRAELGDEP